MLSCQGRDLCGWSQDEKNSERFGYVRIDTHIHVYVSDQIYWYEDQIM